MADNDNPDEPKFIPIGSLSDYPVTITLMDLLKASLAQVEVINLRYENAALRKHNAEVAAELDQAKLENEELAAKLAVAEKRATDAELRLATDPLTSAKRKEDILEALRRAHDEVLKDNKRSKTHSLSLIIGDIDHFKRINDERGHADGDLALAKVGGILNGQKRDSDGLGRFGGEEFLVVLPYCDAADAIKIAEKMRLAIKADNIVKDPQSGEEKIIPITMSFGVATFDLALDTTPKDLFNRADKAVYAAKHNGRDVVCFMDDNEEFQMLKGGILVPAPHKPEEQTKKPKLLEPPQGG